MRCGQCPRNVSWVPGICVALQATQVGRHVPGGLITLITIFFEKFVDDVLEFVRHVRIQAHGRNWNPVKNRVKDGCRRIPCEWRPAGGYLVEDSAKGE